jgi:hypothetical protein
MVRQLVGKKVIYAVWHDRTIRTGWCETVERFWPDDPRPWPHICDDKTGITFTVFGPIVPYDEDTFRCACCCNCFDPDSTLHKDGFERRWHWLMSMDWNRYEDLKRE